MCVFSTLKWPGICHVGFEMLDFKHRGCENGQIHTFIVKWCIWIYELSFSQKEQFYRRLSVQINK